MERFLVFGIYFILTGMFIPYLDEYKNRDNKVIINVLLFIFIFTLGALRNVYTGADTITYVWAFESQSKDFSKIWANTISSFDSEQFYTILSYLFSYITDSGSVWLAFILLWFLIPCAILIYKESENPSISYICILTLFVYTFTWSGLRQNVAMGICIFSTLYLKKKKWWQFVLLVLIAFMFHRSSLIFLLAIPAMYIKPDFRSMIAVLVVFFLALLMPSVFSSTLGFLFKSSNSAIGEKMMGYSMSNDLNANFKTFTYLLLMFGFSFLFKDELIKKNKFNQFCINMALFGCCFQAMTVSIYEFFRIAFYFSIFNMILFANVCQLIQERYYKYNYRMCLVLLTIAVFFYACYFDYWFIWEKHSW